MKTDILKCKAKIDSIVFNHHGVKLLVEKGYVLPESTIEENYMVTGQTAIVYHYHFFGSDCVLSCRVLNNEKDKYLFGWDGDDALIKAANNVINELTFKADPAQKQKYNDTINKLYSEPYGSGKYNED